MSYNKGDFINVSSHLSYSDKYLEVSGSTIVEGTAWVVADGKYWIDHDIAEHLTRQKMSKLRPEYLL